MIVGAQQTGISAAVHFVSEQGLILILVAAVDAHSDTATDADTDTDTHQLKCNS